MSKRERPKEALLCQRECFRSEWKDSASTASTASEMSVTSVASESKKRKQKLNKTGAGNSTSAPPEQHKGTPIQQHPMSVEKRKRSRSISDSSLTQLSETKSPRPKTPRPSPPP
eukprot:CAMPEP_0197521814 /NCGR_PEP_ID=MMETSP1318-20131121/7033_1 /TAXON_ID=552666 /ORGANISM="Partenskyella glossopodia, Strain RCC365" /LENGTH=113 /DNA_ID=CAMNT_0043073943 /DNA_START=225 /DNA_END=566 /DNA_ORIENTATION=-